MEPIWPLYLSDNDCDPMVRGPSKATFDFTVAIAELYRRVQRALSRYCTRRHDVERRFDQAGPYVW